MTKNNPRSDEYFSATTDDKGNNVVKINTELSLCPQKAKVCCKPLPKGPKVKPPAPPPAPPKCGVRHPEGLNFITRTELGEKITQEGEWPHVCTIFKKNSLGNNEFVGGASLIAPGVLITAAHKIE